MNRKRIAIVAAVTLIVGAGSVGAVIVAATGAGHSPMHVGCRHHNHGAKWHAGHGRAVGQPAGRLSDPAATLDVSDGVSTSGGRR